MRSQGKLTAFTGMHMTWVAGRIGRLSADYYGSSHYTRPQNLLYRSETVPHFCEMTGKESPLD